MNKITVHFGRIAFQFRTTVFQTVMSQYLISDMRTMADFYYSNFNKTFGPVPHDILNAPVSQTMINYGTFISNHTQVSDIEGMIAMFPTFYFMTRTYEYLILNPEYVPNHFGYYLTYENFGARPGVSKLREFVDRRSYHKNDNDKMKHYLELFKKGVMVEFGTSTLQANFGINSD